MSSGINKLLFFLSLLFFRATLDLAYIIFVSPLYLYAGFDLEVDVVKYIASWLVMASTCFLVDSRLYKVSSYFFLIAVLSVLAPLSSLYGLSARDIQPLLLMLASISIIYIIVNSRVLKVPRIPVFGGGEKFAVVLSGIMMVFLIMWYFASGAVGYFNLNFSQVYEFRELSAEKANVGILAYLNNWVYQVFSIFLFSYALLKNRFELAALIFIIQIFFFGVSAHKSVLFYPIMVLGIWYYFRRTDRLVIVPLAFSFIVIVCLGFWYVWDHVMAASMFIRRVFFVPAALTYDYYSFFQNNPHVFWSNSFMSGVVDYPYHVSLNELIGEYNKSNAGANNGYFASGYAHAGWVGVLMYSVLFGVIIRFVDVFSKYLPVWFALSIVVVPYRSALISSDLLTVILTHGLFAAVVILVLIRKTREPNMTNFGL